MSKKRCCDLCNNIIKTDYKKAKAKIKDVKKDIKQNSTDNYKWKKIDICMNCYNKFFTPTQYSVSVELGKVDNDTMKKIFNGQDLEPIDDIVSTGIRID